MNGDRFKRFLASLKLAAAGTVSPLMRTRFAHRYFAPFFPALQMWIYRISRGKVQISSLLAPSLVLETTGARTGQARQTPLICAPEPSGTYLVAGSNWGRPNHPAWTANLIAHPEVAIIRRGRRLPMTAELLTGQAREQAWTTIEQYWPQHSEYEQAANREIRVFRLHPRA